MNSLLNEGYVSQTKDGEVWKPIPGYDGIYDASNFGRIRSTPGKTTSNARYPVRVWKSRVLKPKHPTGRKRQDLRVTLWKDGERKDALVSRLVAMAWHGVPSDGMTVNHINGDYTDNRQENLEWLPLGENIRHGFETGLFSSIQKRAVLVGEDGEVLEFQSLSKADAFLGRAIGYTSNSRSGKYAISSSDGKRFKLFVEDKAVSI